MEFCMPIRVYIEDTDAGGIVYYVNYLKYMERARTEFLRSLGFGKTAVQDDGAMFVVHSLQADYRAPARLDDELTATARVMQLGRATMVFEQNVRRGEQLLCSGQVKIACVNSATLGPTAMPEPIRKAVQAFQTAGAKSEE